MDTCTVGYQPEEMVIAGNKLYVANSGGYRVPNYDRTVSVIDLTTFTEIKKIDVAINLHRLELDRYGNIYVSSRGDYYDTPSKTFVIDSRNGRGDGHPAPAAQLRHDAARATRSMSTAPNGAGTRNSSPPRTR